MANLTNKIYLLEGRGVVCRMHRKSEKPNLGKGRNQGSSEAPGSGNQKILSVGYPSEGNQLHLASVSLSPTSRE